MLYFALKFSLILNFAFYCCLSLECCLFKNAKNAFVPVGTYNVCIVISVHATWMLFILVLHCTQFRNTLLLSP